MRPATAALSSATDWLSTRSGHSRIGRFRPDVSGVRHSGDHARLTLIADTPIRTAATERRAVAQANAPRAPVGWVLQVPVPVVVEFLDVADVGDADAPAPPGPGEGSEAELPGWRIRTRNGRRKE